MYTVAYICDGCPDADTQEEVDRAKARILKNIELAFTNSQSMAIMLGFTIYLWYLSMLANPPSCGCLGLTGIFKTNKREALVGVLRNCVILWALKLSYDYHFKPPANIAAKTE